MTVRAVENDIEQAMVTTIENQLSADGITGVSVNGFSLGSPGEEPSKPYVYVACRPLNYGGGGTIQWSGVAMVQVMTQHLEDYDRDATTMNQIFQSVAYALDFGDFSANSTRVNSIALRRTGGEYEVAQSTNSVTLDVEIIKACGVK